MRRFNGLGVLLALAAPGCAASTGADLAAIGTAEGAIAREEASTAAAHSGPEDQDTTAGVAAWVPEGSCAPDTAPPVSNAGESCGGFTLGPAPVCAEGLYCDYSREDVCGWADASGVCVETPVSCTPQEAPVCGCDGQTYVNACLAAMSGVAVYVDGPCDIAPYEGWNEGQGEDDRDESR